MQEPIHQTTVAVTGASAGIGRATALAFARRGCRVALLARGPEGLEAAAREVDAAGGQALSIPCDMSDASAVERAVRRIEAQWGPIRIWVNCAMVTVFSGFDQMSPEEFRRVIEVTLLGYVWGTRAALIHMKRRNRGTIVQVGSALSYRAIPLQAAYCAAKFGIRGFTDSLRSELIHDRSNIRLTMVQLPAVNTPQFDWSRNHMDTEPRPLAPIFQPEAAAEAIVEAARATPRELWVGGSTVKAILGGLLAPGYADQALARQAYAGQMARRPANHSRPDNLFMPVRRDVGVHGRFDDRVRHRPPVRMPDSVMGLGVGVATLAAGAAAAAGVLALGAASRRLLPGH